MRRIGRSQLPEFTRFGSAVRKARRTHKMAQPWRPAAEGACPSDTDTDVPRSRLSGPAGGAVGHGWIRLGILARAHPGRGPGSHAR